jgi:hypothetical protein
MSEIQDIIKTIDYGTVTDYQLEKPKYSDFEMRAFASMKALHDLEAILPQVYLSLQHQLRDPKLPQDLRKTLQKRMMQFESLMTPGIDEIWKIVHPKTTEALMAQATGQPMTLEEARKQYAEKLD